MHDRGREMQVLGGGIRERDSAVWSATRVSMKPRPHKNGATGKTALGLRSTIAAPSRCTKPAETITAEPRASSSHCTCVASQDACFASLAGHGLCK